ncbi:hypothetical protein [Candidatus Nitrosocosmicus franklandus]|uniref:hypothetical protein n=1 Tax=Candidatus Nitrosocosmicus franklandianus TaxID=1798806 RepID=UPI001559AD69|nr:hypothetical protein [Candidatus Nitrosocosmicus franklandus]
MVDEGTTVKIRPIVLKITGTSKFDSKGFRRYIPETRVNVLKISCKIIIQLLTFKKNKRVPSSAVIPNIVHHAPQCGSYYSMMQNYKYVTISNKRQLTV